MGNIYELKKSNPTLLRYYKGFFSFKKCMNAEIT